MHKHAKKLDVPTRFVSREELRREEPDVRAEEAVLESSSTGIVDSHGFMMYLLGQFEDRGGDVAYMTTVAGIQPRDGGGYNVTFRDRDGEETSIDAGVVVNSAGLYACEVSNMLLPEERHLKPYYAKGNYYTYTSSKPKTKRLIYPCPEMNFAGYTPPEIPPSYWQARNTSYFGSCWSDPVWSRCSMDHRSDRLQSQRLPS